MTRLDESRTPGVQEVYKRYSELLRKAENTSYDVAPSDKEAEELRLAKACKDFEAIFIQQMLKEMRRGLNEDASFGLEGAQQSMADKNRSQFFRDQMYQGIAENMAQDGGFGLGSVLFEQLYSQQHPEQLIAKGKEQIDSIKTSAEQFRSLEDEKQNLLQFQQLKLSEIYSKF